MMFPKHKKLPAENSKVAVKIRTLLSMWQSCSKKNNFNELFLLTNVYYCLKFFITNNMQN